MYGTWYCWGNDTNKDIQYFLIIYKCIYDVYDNNDNNNDGNNDASVPIKRGKSKQYL